MEDVAMLHEGDTLISYRVIHPLVRQVLKMIIWGVPLAGGLLLWLISN